jgi:hypothetical protein
MSNPMVSPSLPFEPPVDRTGGAAALGAIAAELEALDHGASPAVGTGPAARYQAELGAIELDRALAQLLETRRQTEWLLCRYLADIAEGRRFREIGCYSDILHYARERHGLSVKATRERLRIGRALRALPRIEHAFVGGLLSFSRVRELTRVATTDDQDHWLELGRRLPMRELERRVAAVVGAEAMTDAPADVRWRTPEWVELRIKLPAEAWALLSRAMQGARETAEAPMSDAQALEAVAREALARLCQAGGAASGTVPAAVRRAVLARDRARCRVCGRRRHVEVHHFVPRSQGGAHSRSNCATLCISCNAALREGKLRAEGAAPQPGLPTEGAMPDHHTPGPGGATTDDPTSGPEAAMSADRTAGINEPFVVDASALLRAMGGRGGWTADDLIEATHLGAARVAAALSALQLERRAVSDGLGRFSPVAPMSQLGRPWPPHHRHRSLDDRRPARGAAFT